MTVGASLLYKLDVLDGLRENDFEDLRAEERSLTEFFKFELDSEDQDRGYQSVFSVIELDNESDVWRNLGRSPDLLCVVKSSG